MPNPILDAMNKNSLNQTSSPANNNIFASAVKSVKNMMGMLKTAGNPQLALNNVAKNNPALNMVVNLVGGRNPKDVFYEQCEKAGVDPNIIINQLR